MPNIWKESWRRLIFNWVKLTIYMNAPMKCTRTMHRIWLTLRDWPHAFICWKPSYSTPIPFTPVSIPRRYQIASQMPISHPRPGKNALKQKNTKNIVINSSRNNWKRNSLSKTLTLWFWTSFSTCRSRTSRKATRWTLWRKVLMSWNSRTDRQLRTFSRASIRTRRSICTCGTR